MGKHKHKVVQVPHIHNMDDDTFLKHLEKRHAGDTDVEEFVRVNIVSAWVKNYRAFHDRLHELATPEQYDHEHDKRGF